MLRCRTVTSLLVTAVLATSCGGDGEEGAAPTTAPPSSTATSVAPTTMDPAMAGRAEAAVFQAADFPPGWSAQPAEEGLDLEMTWSDLLRCMGVDAAPGAMATSPTFLRGLATQARSTVEYTNERSAGAIAAALGGERFEGCAQESFAADARRAAPEGGVPGPVEVAPLDLAPLGRGSTSAFRINVTISMQDLQVPIFQDFVVVFDGGTVARMMFLNPGSAFPPDLERSLIEKVLARA